MRDDAQHDHLRRGAWYPVLSLGPDEVVLVVRQKPLIIPLSFLEIVDTLPNKWTVPAGREYAVCPNCAERVAVGTLPERMSCERCGGAFEFELKTQDAGMVARDRGELSSLE
jgi:ribosomal protein S27AE